MNIHGIETDSMLNGDGLRVVLWVSGCNHHCPCSTLMCWWMVSLSRGLRILTIRGQEAEIRESSI